MMSPDDWHDLARRKAVEACIDDPQFQIGLLCGLLAALGRRMNDQERAGFYQMNGIKKLLPSKIEATDAGTITDTIIQNVEVGSTLHTDEHLSYAGIGGLFFDHDTINHSNGEYVRDGVTTNSIESVFAVMKRGLIGVYHHASPKHLGRYVDEFAFRLNDGNVARHTMERLDSFVKAVAGKRLTYKSLIA